MKTYFVVSDIHGFYDEFKRDLEAAGFNIDNEEHCLIVCGDIFDRGTQSLQVYEFLKSFPKNRRILIRGNHEILLRDLVNRHYAESFDMTNGTYDTLYQFADIGFKNSSEMNFSYYRELVRVEFNSKQYEEIQNNYDNLRKRLYQGKIKEVIDWIFSDEWINYYETDKYIFVHSFIPLGQNYKFNGGWPLKDGEPFYREEWRTCTDAEWEDAMWECPWKLYLKYFQPEIKKHKTLVCGHWHTSDFWNNLDYKNDVSKQLDVYTENPIYKSKKYPNLIGIDACTAVTHTVNVLIIKEEEM